MVYRVVTMYPLALLLLFLSMHMRLASLCYWQFSPTVLVMRETLSDSLHDFSTPCNFGAQRTTYLQDH